MIDGSGAAPYLTALLLIDVTTADLPHVTAQRGQWFPIDLCSERRRASAPTSADAWLTRLELETLEKL
jgi:hypothetical protein